MEYTHTGPLLSIDHPVFPRRSLLLQPPFIIPEPREDGATTPPRRPAPVGCGAESVPAACLLDHISSQPTQRKPKPLYLPPAQGEDHHAQGFLVDTETGEVLVSLPESGLFSTREILWEKATHDDCKYWLQVYRKDLIIKRPCIQVSEGTTGKRGKIWQFSEGSSRRLKFLCRNSGHHIKSQFCCTFHNSWPLDGKSLKAMIGRLINRIKRKFGRGLHYIWVLEFQEREAPHLHLFLDLPATRQNRWFLADAWLDVSDQMADPVCRRFHRNPKNFFTWEMKSGDYLVKEYIGKIEQKEVPESFRNVGRFWGASRNMTPDFSTLDPRDHEDGIRICVEQALRITTRHHEKQIDTFKAFGVLFNEALSFIGLPFNEIPGKTKKQIALAIRKRGDHLTTRLRPKTNFRRRTRTTNLTGKAELFLDTLNWLTAPPPPSNFRAFSKWADDPTQPPPPRRKATPF